MRRLLYSRHGLVLNDGFSAQVAPTVTRGMPASTHTGHLSSHMCAACNPAEMLAIVRAWEVLTHGAVLYRLAENAWAQKLEEASETLTHRAALDHVRRVAAAHVEQTNDKGVSWEIDAFFVEWATSEAATQVLQDLLMVSMRPWQLAAASGHARPHDVPCRLADTSASWKRVALRSPDRWRGLSIMSESNVLRFLLQLTLHADCFCSCTPTC